jgi:hypothetical protein
MGFQSYYETEIDKELARAKELHPDYPKDLIYQLAIMLEEAGEAMRAGLQFMQEGGKIDEVEKELIQTSAMCIRCLEGLDETFNYACEQAEKEAPAENRLIDLEVGLWVEYRDGTSREPQVGRVKSWNDKFVFVVFHCNNLWDDFKDYTGQAVRLKDLDYHEQ